MIGDQPLILVPGRFMQTGLVVAMIICSIVGGWAAGRDIWWLLSICWLAGLLCAALWGHGACARMLALAYPELVGSMNSDGWLFWPSRHRRAWVRICWGVLAANVAVFVWGLIYGNRLWLAGLGVVISYYACRTAEKRADEKP